MPRRTMPSVICELPKITDIFIFIELKKSSSLSDSCAKRKPNGNHEHKKMTKTKILKM
jgi:hypothetical protein